MPKNLCPCTHELRYIYKNFWQAGVTSLNDNRTIGTFVPKETGGKEKKRFHTEEGVFFHFFKCVLFSVLLRYCKVKFAAVKYFKACLAKLNL